MLASGIARGLLALALLTRLPSAIAEGVDDALRDLVASGPVPYTSVPVPARDAPDLRRFYEERAFGLAWHDEATPRAARTQALELLVSSDSHGLDPRDYRGEVLAAEAAALERSPNASPRDLAALDVALTASLLRYLDDLHAGRVRPQAIHPELHVAPRPVDRVALIREAIAAERVSDLADRVAPSVLLYSRLRAALAAYRDLAARGPWPPLPAARKGDRGSTYAGVGVLRSRLAALGDLAPGAVVPPAPRYDGELVAAVKRFQSRHGLAPDGVLDPATRAALDVPPAERVRQIELAMERLRWLPEFPARPLVVVNIPAFRLWVFDLPDDARVPTLAMRVVVGKALDTETPVLADTLRTIEFSPNWNVPRSILQNELLPRLKRDPGYLARQGMEFVAPDGTAISRADAASLAALEAGALRVRQRPGPANPMGRIKFVLPNNLAIFLHDTSSPRLFARQRRDFSHGCIRVEQPVELALFALDGAPGWDAERVHAAMSAGKPSYAQLRRPLTVLVFYTTAVVDANGAPHFYADIYGHDRQLTQALSAPR